MNKNNIFAIMWFLLGIGSLVMFYNSLKSGNDFMAIVIMVPIAFCFMHAGAYSAYIMIEEDDKNAIQKKR